MLVDPPNDLAIIIHGLIDEQLLEDVKQLKKNVVFSCWSNNNLDFGDYHVTKNEEPSDSQIGNLIKQSKSILYGCDLAKNMGFKRALKIRGDMFIKNKISFIDSINNDKLNFFSWHFCDSVPNSKGYIVDYFMSGKLEDIEFLWSVNLSLGYPIAEQYITHNFLKLLKEKDLKYNFIFDKINQDNDVFWSKKNTYLSTYKSHELEYDGDLSDKNFIHKSYYGMPSFSSKDLEYLFKFHRI